MSYSSAFRPYYEAVVRHDAMLRRYMCAKITLQDLETSKKALQEAEKTFNEAFYGEYGMTKDLESKTLAFRKCTDDLRARIAKALNWTAEDTNSLSLASLRELVPSQELKAEISTVINLGAHIL